MEERSSLFLPSMWFFGPADCGGSGPEMDLPSPPPGKSSLSCPRTQRMDHILKEMTLEKVTKEASGNPLDVYSARAHRSSACFLFFIILVWSISRGACSFPSFFCSARWPITRHVLQANGSLPLWSMRAWGPNGSMKSYWRGVLPPYSLKMVSPAASWRVALLANRFLGSEKILSHLIRTCFLLQRSLIRRNKYSGKVVAFFSLIFQRFEKVNCAGEKMANEPSCSQQTWFATHVLCEILQNECMMWKCFVFWGSGLHLLISHFSRFFWNLQKFLKA